MPETKDPSHGDILQRIDGLETRFTVAIETVAKELKSHGEEEKRTAAFLFGGPDAPGLAELVRQHDRWIATQRRILLALVPAVFLGVGAVLWQTVAMALGSK